MSAMVEATSVQYTADTIFDYVVVPSGPGIVRAETTDGLAIVSHGTRPQIIQGKAANVHIRIGQHYPNAVEVGLGKRVTHLHAVRKGTGVAVADVAPLVKARFAAALPVATGFHAKKVTLTERERLERYGDPWDQIHPMFKPLLTRNRDSRFAMVRNQRKGR